MTSFMARTAKHILVIKAARAIRKEIEKAGVDNLKILAEAGKSIVGTYLQGCSPQEKATYRHNLKALSQMGVTPAMLLTEIAKQLPELAPIMQGSEDYGRSEIQSLEQFLLTTD